MATTTAVESKGRSILKAITWRIIATGTTFILAYLVFSGTDCENALEKSTLVASMELVIKLAAFYLHERAWLMLPRGAIRRFAGKFGLK